MKCSRCGREGVEPLQRCWYCHALTNANGKDVTKQMARRVERQRRLAATQVHYVTPPRDEETNRH